MINAPNTLADQRSIRTREKKLGVLEGLELILIYRGHRYIQYIGEESSGLGRIGDNLNYTIAINSIRGKLGV